MRIHIQIRQHPMSFFFYSYSSSSWSTASLNLVVLAHLHLFLNQYCFNRLIAAHSDISLPLLFGFPDIQRQYVQSN